MVSVSSKMPIKKSGKFLRGQGKVGEKSGKRWAALYENAHGRERYILSLRLFESVKGSPVLFLSLTHEWRAC